MKIYGNNWPLIKRCIWLPFSNLIFLYLCGQFSIRSEMSITMLMTKAACEPHFGCKINCHNNKWASHVCCSTSAGVLWILRCSLMKNYMLYTYDLEGNDDSNSDCYFCDNKLEIGTLNTPIFNHLSNQWHRNHLYLIPQPWHQDDDAGKNSDDGQIFADKMNCGREYEIPHYIYYQLIALVQLVGNKYNFVHLLCGKRIVSGFKKWNTKLRKHQLNDPVWITGPLTRLKCI
jgi:hypothetical protein